VARASTYREVHCASLRHRAPTLRCWTVPVGLYVGLYVVPVGLSVGLSVSGAGRTHLFSALPVAPGAHTRRLSQPSLTPLMLGVHSHIPPDLAFRMRHELEGGRENVAT